MNRQRKCGVYTQGVLLSREENWNPVNCSKIDGAGGPYIKWNKTDMEPQVPLFSLSYVYAKTSGPKS